MLSKIFSGHCFYGAVRYVCQDRRRSQVLEVEGVRGHDYRLMIQDFRQQQALRPSKKQACFHSILSFYPGENPGQKKMVEIAEKYLRELGIADTQYAIVLHTDKAHLHLHIIANLVNNKGQAIQDNWIGLRGKKLAQQLTQQYQLVPALEKNLTITNKEALSESEAIRYKIYEAIRAALPHCHSLAELRDHLQSRGIDTQLKYKGQTQEVQGISFKMGEYCFKGSKIDRKFSFGNLEKTFVLQQKQALEQKHSSVHFARQLTLTKPGQQHKQLEENHHHISLAKGMKKAVEGLFESRPAVEPFSAELLKEAREKKKKQQSQSRGLHP